MKIVLKKWGASGVASDGDCSPSTHHAPRSTLHTPQLPFGLRTSDFGLRLSTWAPRPSERGIALIIVMISIFVLAMLAGGFAWSMKVETKLARNGNSEEELQWLGRSGVEYARWILAQQMTIPGENTYDGLDQVWAGGPGGLGTSNSPLAEVQNPVSLGNGSFKWEIQDLERKANINAPEPILQPMLQQALYLMGVDAGEMTPIIGSILNWTASGGNTRHLQGAEPEYYERLEPPYTAKNGPIDDLSELLLIRGIREMPELYWGTSASDHPPSAFTARANRSHLPTTDGPSIPVGLVDLFTPLSSGKININTASSSVLQLIPGIDAQTAEAIVAGRSGEDDGSGMFGPYKSLQAVARVPELPRTIVNQLAQFCDVRSRTFKVNVTATLNGYPRYFTAILGRNNPRDVQILSFYWTDAEEQKH